MNKEISDARKAVAIPIHRTWCISSVGTRGNVCPVCGVRFNSKTDKECPCEVCKERRDKRLDAWLSNERPPGTTIWISEVADRNDRVALLTFDLPISKWLDGSRVDSLRVQSAVEWCRNNPQVQQYGINPDTAYGDLLEYVKKRVSEEFNPNDPVLRLLQDGYQRESEWEKFFAKIVEDRADCSKAPKWGELNDRERAEWLVYQLFRKNASPGRLYRFWRTAEEFFNGLLKKFLEIAAKDSNKWRARRLALEPSPQTSTGWEDQMVYNGRFDDAPISLIYRKTSQDFLTVCNLSWFSPEALKDKPICVKGDNDKIIRQLIIANVREEVTHLGGYIPLI